MRSECPEADLTRLWRLSGLLLGGLLPYGVCYLYDTPAELWVLVAIFFFLSIPFAFLFSWFLRLLFEVMWHRDEQAFACGVCGGVIGGVAGLLPYMRWGATRLDPELGSVLLFPVTLSVLFACLAMQLVRGFKRFNPHEVIDEE